jgi:hypothetical protein
MATPFKPCTVSGCNKRLLAKGFCSMHYYRDRIANPRTISHSALERFTEKYAIEPVSGCWLWCAGMSTTGYGSFSVNGRPDHAHRASWILHHGPIPPDLFVCHRCDVRKCVNPDHLWLGTHQQNITDMVEKGRNPRGTQHKRASLTEEQVRFIRTHIHWTYARIATHLGVSWSAVGRVARGERYRDISP